MRINIYAHLIIIEILNEIYARAQTWSSVEYVPLARLPDHVLASRTEKTKSCVHRSDFVHVTTRTSHDHGFIEIGAGFIVHGFSLFRQTIFNNGFSCWIQFNRRTSENHYVFTRTKKAVLQFYSVKWTFLILVKFHTTSTAVVLNLVPVY